MTKFKWVPGSGGKMVEMESGQRVRTRRQREERIKASSGMSVSPF